MATGTNRTRPPAGTDVASRAGVSQKTVSRVMNGEPYVKEEVRLRVLRAAQELGYRRNNAARALNSGRTQRIGVVSLGSALYGPSSMLIELERAARSTGYSLSASSPPSRATRTASPARSTRCSTEGVDGIVLSEPIDEGENVTVDVDIPVLSLGRFPGLTGPRVVITGARRRGRRPDRHRAPALARAPHRLARRGTAALVVRPGPPRRLARGAAGRRCRRTTVHRRRLVARLGLRGGQPAGAQSRRHRGVRRQRRHGDRRHARVRRGRPPRAR